MKFLEEKNQKVETKRNLKEGVEISKMRKSPQINVFGIIEAT